jgi:hypothetical protein
LIPDQKGRKKKMKQILKLFLICALFLIPQIKGTNALFTSTEKKLSASMTTAADFSAPISEFFSPLSNQNVSGSSIFILGRSTDESTVLSTKLLYSTFDGTQCGESYTEITVLTNSIFERPFNWTFTWAPPNSSGFYCIKAEATDNFGNVEKSPIVENIKFNKIIEKTITEEEIAPPEISPTLTPTITNAPTVTPTEAPNQTPTQAPENSPTPTPEEIQNSPTPSLETSSPTPTIEENTPTPEAEEPQQEINPEPTAEPTAEPTT